MVEFRGADVGPDPEEPACLVEAAATAGDYAKSWKGPHPAPLFGQLYSFGGDWGARR